MNPTPKRATLAKAPLPPASTPDVVGQVVAASAPAAEPARRGPGRPRTKVRYENISTKIRIDLRDRLDEELAATKGTDDEVTVIQALDQALTAWLDAREARRGGWQR